MYYPFTSKTEWEVVKWVKLHGSSSTTFLDLLSIDGVKQVVITGEAFDVYYHDIIKCVKSLYSDLDFARYLTFAPEWHYTDEDQTVCLFHDMHTGKWWWEMQKKLDEHCPGGTIVLIIISSDKTQVTMFCNKTAYPIYLTIGNIPKEIRHKPSCGTHILLAYLPTTCLEHMTNKASCCRTIANLYHACLCRVLALLKPAGLDGVLMHSGDGALHCCHLLFTSFVGDYPEQLLATGIKFRECPKCDVKAKDTGSNMVPFHLRKLGEVLDALAALDHGNLAFVCACATAGVRPIIHPFWEDLPFANIFWAITPDVLHQLYQGLIKHLLGWLSAAFGAAEIDTCCRWLPPNHHIHIFTKGITCLSHVSGAEHAQICCFILGIIIDISLPDNLDVSHLLRSVQGLLDFLYLAQYPCHSSETLHSLDEALDLFHENKEIFIQLAKDAYCATNHKDEFIQMTCWLEQKEKILWHLKYVTWCLAGGHQSEPYHSHPPDMTFRHELVMTRHPSAKAVSIQKLVEDYGATHFHEALTCYITRHSQSGHPEPLQDQALENLAGNIHFPFQSLPVFHKIKCKGHVTLDSVHAKPQQRSGSRLVAHRCHLVANNYLPTRLAIFALPPKSIPLLFPPTFDIPPHLAYIEWFTPFPSTPDRNNGLYKLSRSMRSSDRVASVELVGDIEHSVHLIPRFGDIAPQEWTSETVLDDCNTFWLNSYIDRHINNFANLAQEGFPDVQQPRALQLGAR
ncbi:uncharacterized protein BJ212DRAFT_1443604 [Suillus subaureus]|uniref:Uncharacterized protein n=1 Tax=Suillus subaureus TaxID=48587 RepID=A0A9P7JJ33_9AGAM|nr:uncharacterized protein BJ212DRAFT_1443604 [Suillus subaureus]KAG1825461.1 hypothetical protein BJ212DRAFT_1443604 [Suillus subaureus]